MFSSVQFLRKEIEHLTKYFKSPVEPLFSIHIFEVSIA